VVEVEEALRMSLSMEAHLVVEAEELLLVTPVQQRV
jgi:hypothetical protein